MESLEFLDLSINELESLPETFINLKSLKDLFLTGNSELLIDESLTFLPSIEEIEFGNSDLLDYFDSISRPPLEEQSLNNHLFREFLHRLGGPEGCNWNRGTWRCGSPKFKYSRIILNRMKIVKMDQDLLLEICKDYGGFCDCEILLNAYDYFRRNGFNWEVVLKEKKDKNNKMNESLKQKEALKRIDLSKFEKMDKWFKKD